MTPERPMQLLYGVQSQRANQIVTLACPACGSKLVTQREDTPPRLFCTTCDYVEPKG